MGVHVPFAVADEKLDLELCCEVSIVLERFWDDDSRDSDQPRDPLLSNDWELDAAKWYPEEMISNHWMTGKFDCNLKVRLFTLAAAGGRPTSWTPSRFACTTI